MGGGACGAERKAKAMSEKRRSEKRNELLVGGRLGTNAVVLFLNGEFDRGFEEVAELLLVAR